MKFIYLYLPNAVLLAVILQLVLNIPVL